MGACLRMPYSNPAHYVPRRNTNREVSMPPSCDSRRNGNVLHRGLQVENIGCASSPASLGAFSLAMGDWGGGDGGGRGRMGGQKRQFPYWSEVQPMEVRQRQAVGVQPELDPRYGIPRHAPSSLLDDADQVGSARSPGFLDHLCSARPCT